MTDINTATLCGRLTRDPELKHAGELPILKFSLAVNRSVKKDGQWTDEASFFDCEMIGKRAESVSRYMEKGKQVGIVGELKQDRWEKDGQKRSRVVILARDIQLFGGRGQGEQSTAAHAVDSSFGDDVPF